MKSMLLFIPLVLVNLAYGGSPEQRPVYLDPARPVADRVEDLLNRMTLAEKIGQLNMPCVYVGSLGNTIADKKEGVQKFTRGTLVAGIGPCGGFFTLPNTILPEGTRQQVQFHNMLQKIAIDETRLKIPLLLTEEGTHGLMCSGATIFPEGPALGSMWNLDLLARIYRATAKEARAIGVHQIFTLVVEPIRDPRLGRNQEAYSEDPYLCSRYAETIVKAVQGHDVSGPDKVVAGLCHYPGQSQPASGLERGAMEISERTLREIFLPPWEAGIKKAGALGVMATYPAIDGVPAHASAFLLTKILREELNFTGLVLSEGSGIETLVYEGLAATQKQAGQLALQAGVDVGISFESGYLLDLLTSVQEGLVSEQLVNRAVRRILAQKFRLGLFEHPFVDLKPALALVHHPEHQYLALAAARESIVLLKNDGNLLPLAKSLKSIAVIGPNADHARNQLGDYTSIAVLQDIITVLAGIKSVVSSQTRVTYVKGCDVIGTAANEIDQARQAAARAEAAILVLGENEWRQRGPANERLGTDGEAFDAATLELTGLQLDLARAVVATGTPTVVVLINGRALALPWIADQVPAVLECWLPGEKGGQAVAEVLFGEINPAGKLPVTFPRHAGQLPVYYNYKKSKRYWLQHAWGQPYVDLAPTPLYPFGHGLSYTQFAYSNLLLSAKEITKSDTLHILLDVENVGQRAGKETVQLYLEDLIATVATPVLALKGFARVDLEPGEKKTVRLMLTADHLSLYDRTLQKVVEPGVFRLMLGSSSQDLRLQDEFKVVE